MSASQPSSTLCGPSLAANVSVPLLLTLEIHIASCLHFYSDFIAKAVRTGALPGVTRSVEGLVRVFDDPKTYLIDTPGVMVPNVKDIETGMKLALIGSVRDEVVGIQVIAAFLLKIFNERGFTG